jgi:outer membrane protein assembly factor BamB
MTRIVLGAAVAAAVVAQAAAPASGTSGWPLPNLGLSSTRALTSSGIDRRTVRRLHVVWRFRLAATPGPSGDITATPVVANGVVYVQDMASTVFALDERTGRLLWRHRFVYAHDPGPNGLAVDGNRVYGATPTNAFALAADSGRLLWTRRLTQVGAPIIDVAPVVAHGIVYTSTIGLPPGGKGVLFALDAATGAIRWRLSTVKGEWAVPREAGGGGAWYPPSVAGRSVYWGTANPYPYGGTRAHPNGGAFAGAALYTDSLVVADARTGRLQWYDQVTPHDVRDHDFQLSPILSAAGGVASVIGSGKGGIVVAWDRVTHRRLWTARVGLRRNDSGALPRRRVPVCPGLLGGVETPMALAAGTLFVPVVDLCSPGGADGYEPLAHLDVSKGRGELVALDARTGRRRWTARLPSPDLGCATAADGVVFTSTYDGRLYGFDARSGARLWSARASAGVNACPALADDMLFVGAGVPLARGDALELEAFSS